MNCYDGIYRGLKAFFLENGLLRVCVLPSQGAKIASLIHKPSRFETLFQPPNGLFGFPQYGDSFADFDASGADDMFPTIDACAYPHPDHANAQCPDHGELWAVPWSVKRGSGGDSLECRSQGKALPYVFERRMTLLSQGRLRLDYRVENDSDKPLWGLWAFHGLFACDEHSRLELPRAKGQPSVKVRTVQPSGPLGPSDTLLDFPLHTQEDGTCLDVAAIAPASAATTKKIYVDGPVETGEAAITLNHGALCCSMTWDPQLVPYLGVWITEGGFRGDYNAALEPTTGFYDDLERATHNGLQPIPPRDTLSFWLEISISSI